MLPSYPPVPPHLTGFDMMLAYASVEDPDHGRARRIGRALRRESLRRKATLSAAKALGHLHEPDPRAALRVARRLSLEAPCAASYRRLVFAEMAKGNVAQAQAAACRMLSLAMEVGDLDEIETARWLVDRPGAVDEPMAKRRDRSGDELGRASGLEADGYEAVRSHQREALGLSGRATAIRCGRVLLQMAAQRADLTGGLTFARELAEMEASSFSYLALGLAHERVGDTTDARAGFARALRFACVEGDIHRATKATAGLLRVNGQELVTRTELRWAMPEAEREPVGLPDYRFLRATLGFPDAA